MANEKISDFGLASTPLDFTEEIEIVQGGDNKRVPISELGQNLPFVTFDPSPTPGVHQTGKVYYDSTDQTLALMTAYAGVILQIGRELHIEVRNNTGVEIGNGKAVYISGVLGNIATIALAKADALATCGVVGYTTNTIANNANGLVTPFGVLHDLDTSGLTEGLQLYLSETTAGEVIDALPASGYKVYMGRCLYSHSSSGEILYIPSPVVEAVGP